jgi:putative permease
MDVEKSGPKTVLILAAAFLLFILAGHFLRHTFSALLTALVFSYLLNPLLKYLEKRGFDRFTSLLLMYGIGVFAAFLASFLFIPYLGHQLDSLSTSLPVYVRNLQQSIDHWKATLAPYYAGDEGAWLLEQIEGALDLVTREFSGVGYARIKALMFGVFDLVLAPILIFFILTYKRYFQDTLKRLLPHKERRRLIRLGRRINLTLERFVVSMLLDCLLVGILTALALYLLGIEYPVLNGLFAGFASIVPFVGVMVAVIPAAFFGYAKSGDLTIIPKVCAAYFFIHVILEGNLIKPLIMKRTLKLNPLAVIFAVMAMGEMLGFWGIVLSIPLAALVKICMAEVKGILVPEDEDAAAAL